MRDLKERLRDEHRQQEFATTWKPEAGDVLVGIFEKMDHGETKFGECEIAHLRDESGELMGVWLFHEVLRREWGEADPEPGAKVGIVYHGERDGSDFSYHNYTVEKETRDESPEDRPPQRPDGETLDGREQAERLYGDEDTGDRPDPTLNDPNSELPY